VKVIYEIVGKLAGINVLLDRTTSRKDSHRFEEASHPKKRSVSSRRVENILASSYA
jgi:hypothetical protein